MKSLQHGRGLAQGVKLGVRGGESLSCSEGMAGSEILVSKQREEPALCLVMHVTSPVRTEVLSWLDLHANGANE